MAREVFKKPAPSARIPFGFAMTTLALAPATSRKPRSSEGFLLVTSLTMMRAGPPMRFGLPSMYPASCVLAKRKALLRMAPRSGTLKAS